MSLRLQIHLAIAAALVGGVLFAIGVHHVERMLESQSLVQSKLHHMEQADARLDRELLKSASRLYYNVDAVVASVRDVKDALAGLEAASYMGEEELAPVRALIDTYRTQLKEKERLALRFGTINSLVKNSTTHIPTLTNRYVNTSAEIDPEYLADLSAITASAFLAATSLDRDFLASLEEKVRVMSAVELDSPELARLNRTFLAHARVLLRWLPAYVDTLSQTLAVPTSATLEEAKRHFIVISRSHANQVKAISLLLAALFAMAVGIVAIMLVALHRKHVAMEQAATTDLLTSLPNRFAYRREQPFASGTSLLLFNIDGFRHLNDFFGSDAGDSVLQTLGKALQQRAAGIDRARVFRLGGDDFGLLLGADDEDSGIHAASELARKIVADCDATPFRYLDNHLPVSITASASASTPLLETADMALKQVKRQRLRFLQYGPELDLESKAASNLQIVRLLKKAISEDAVVPFFQPIVDNRTGQTAHFECLMRVRGEGESLLFPGEFLGVAKESRQYAELTRVMVERCVPIFDDLDIGFSLNLSIEDIRDTRVREHLFAILDRHPRAARRLTIEILESEGVASYEEIARFVAAIRGKGCKIAIDDFGSGYSNLLHVLSLDVDVLKIDGSLVRVLDTDPNARILVASIVDFARRIGIRGVVAEHVHNAEILKVVQELGVDYSQGFYLGRPAPELSGYG